MTWYYVVAIVVAILVGATGIVTALIKGIWVLSGLFGGIKTDVAVLTSKVESMQTMQSSLQARTIRLEEKVDKLGQ